MKFLILAMMVSSFLVPCVQAQIWGWEINSVSIGTGDGPVSSGLSIVIDYKKESEYLLQFNFQQEIASIIYGKFISSPNFKMKIMSTLSTSIVKGTPSLGPFIIVSMPLIGYELKIIQWPVIFLWEPKNRSEQKSLIGYFSKFEMKTEMGFSFSYSFQKFLDDPWNQMPGIEHLIKIGEKTSVSGSATWNSNREEWMLFLSIRHQF